MCLSYIWLNSTTESFQLEVIAYYKILFSKVFIRISSSTLKMMVNKKIVFNKKGDAST